MDTKHRLLLAQVRLLYERHGQKDRGKKQFNIFTTLRKSSDEVNLHSRFLHALLDHRESLSDRRRNLEDFLTTVASVKCFPVNGVTVQREFDNIDLLIENDSEKQAVVIENKIWAGDQEQQLQRYWEKLEKRGYPRYGIHLLYLTPFGDPPSKQSIGDLNCKEVSYCDLQPWLKSCQERAFGDPALRESIAQYRELVSKLTDTNRSAEYMANLKKLCLTDDNLILAHELSQALVEAKSVLVCKLGKVIDKELAEIEDFPSRDENTRNCLTEYDDVRSCLASKRGKPLTLYYPINEGAGFMVGAGNEPLWYGVWCDKDHFLELYTHLQEILSGVSIGRRRHDDHDPWYRYVAIEDAYLDIRELNLECLLLLMSEKRRRELAKTISTQMSELLREIKKSDLLKGCKE